MRKTIKNNYVTIDNLQAHLTVYKRNTSINPMNLLLGICHKFPVFIMKFHCFQKKFLHRKKSSFWKMTVIKAKGCLIV